jgi:hypothetical protein
MRCLRIGRDANYVCGLGVSNLSGIVSLTNPGTLRLIRNEDRTVLVTTDAGLSLTRDWLGGTAQRIEVLTLDDEWMDVTNKCHDNNIPPELVQACSQAQERVLVQFGLTSGADQRRLERIDHGREAQRF